MHANQTLELGELRSKIDQIDQELLHLLAQRFRIVDHVIETKHRTGMPAAIASRVEQVIGNAKAAAKDIGLPPDSVEKIWTLLVAETIAYETAKGVSSVGVRPVSQP